MIALACLGAIFLGLWGAAYACFPPLLSGVRSGAARLARWLRGRARLGPLFGRLETFRSYLPLVLAQELEHFRSRSRQGVGRG